MSRVIIDTREEFEYSQSHVDGAINIPPATFMTGDIPPQLVDVAKDAEIIVYCRSGQRSNTVGQILRGHGFSNVINGVNEQHVAKRLAEES